MGGGDMVLCVLIVCLAAYNGWKRWLEHRYPKPEGADDE